MPSPTLAKLWDHPLFAVLLPNQRQWLTERISLEESPARSTIYNHSEHNEFIFFILKGKAKVETSSPSGDNHLIKKICFENDLFGLKGLFEKNGIIESVRTLRTPVSCIKFNVGDLKRLAEVNFEFAQILMRTVWNELRELEKRTNTLTQLSARERFAKFLWEMTEKEGVFDGKEWFFNSQLTQAEIGAYIGTGRQTVTEILNEFREKEILRYSWGRFFVQKREALK